MPVWIVLLRGVNVGGNNSLPMKEFAKALESLGCESVQTLIQSGNAVLKSPEQSGAALAGRIAGAIEERCGFRPHVRVLGRAALDRVVEQNPFPEGAAIPKSLHAFFLDGTPAAPDRAGLEAVTMPTERWSLQGDVFYLHAPDGIGRSKLAASAERRLGVPATARNWNTVEKLRALAAEL